MQEKSQKYLRNMYEKIIKMIRRISISEFNALDFSDRIFFSKQISSGTVETFTNYIDFWKNV